LWVEVELAQRHAVSVVRSEEGDSMFLRNVCRYRRDLHGAKCQNVVTIVVIVGKTNLTLF
jgi:hypothetical protein